MHLHTDTPSDGGSARRGPRLTSAALVVALVASLSAGCVIEPTRHPYRYGPPPAPVQAAAALPPMYFYPDRGQPEAQQDRDRYECYRLAVRDSGVDPGMTPVSRAWTPPPPPVRRDGADVVGGAATGAIVGAVVSGPRHAGQNAVIGAVFGALLGAAAQESRAQAAEAAQARQAEAAARARQPLDNFRRAMGACMQSRGYTVG
jgi:YMGG-like Gly-zipper